MLCQAVFNKQISHCICVSLWAASLSVGCYYLHPQSSFQKLHTHRSQRRHCSKGAQPVPKAVYCSGSIINTQTAHCWMSCTTVGHVTTRPLWHLWLQSLQQASMQPTRHCAEMPHSPVCNHLLVGLLPVHHNFFLQSHITMSIMYETSTQELFTAKAHTACTQLQHGHYSEMKATIQR